MLKDIYQSIAFHFPKRKSTIPAATIVRTAFDNGCRSIFFGEDHHESRVMEAQCSVFYHMHALKQPGDALFLVMEAFNCDQQQHIDAYLKGEISSANLIEEYNRSEEGFDLNHYLPLINLAREGGAQVRAGFPPRPTARRAIEGNRDVWEEAKSKGWLLDVSKGSSIHFQWFKSLFTGTEWTPPSSFRGKSFINKHDNTATNSDTNTPAADDGSRASRIFPAQVFKDAVLAGRVHKILRDDPHAKVMVVCGRGHSDFWLGAPERVCEGVCENEKVCVLSARTRTRGYEDEEGNEKVEMRSVEDVVNELDERMCDGVFIYE